MPFGSAPEVPAAPAARAAVLLWNAMGGTVDWAALPVLIELYQVPDIDAAVAHLLLIRDRMAQRMEPAWPSPP